MLNTFKTTLIYLKHTISFTLKFYLLTFSNTMLRTHTLDVREDLLLEQQAIDIRKKSEISLKRSKSKLKEREQVADARVQERLALRQQKSIQRKQPNKIKERGASND